MIDSHLADLTNSPNEVIFNVPYEYQKQESQFLPETIKEFHLDKNDRLGGIKYKYDHINQNKLIAKHYNIQNYMNQNFKLSLKNKSNSHNLHLIK